MTPKVERKPGSERFTLLEAKGPTNPTPAQLALPVAEGVHAERFTLLEAKGPTNPTPAQLALPVAEEPAGVVTALSAWIAEQRRFGVIPPGEPAEVIAHRTLDRLRHELSRAAG